MKTRAIGEWVVLPLVVGTALMWTGVWTVARTALFLIDKRFFGLPLPVVFAADDFVLWGLMSLPAGLLVGYVAWRQPISIALLTSVVALLAFLASGVFDDLALGAMASFLLFLEPFVTMIVFIPLGAWMGARLRRGLTMRSSGP